MAKIWNSKEMTTPDYGDIDGPVKKCVGCGFCCLKAPCEASRRLYGPTKICPQLLWDEKDNRYKCGLMLISGQVGFGYRQELYEGAGCCSGLNSWRQDVRKRHLVKEENINPIDSVFQIFLKCLMSNFISGDVIILTLHQMQDELMNRGYSDNQIKKILQSIISNLQNNRSSFMKEFMG